MSKCLNMFILIIQPSLNIWRYEPTYRWKYGFKLFEICLYIISKDRPRMSKIWRIILQVSLQIQHTSIVNSTHICCKFDDIVLQSVIEKPMLRTSKIRWYLKKLEGTILFIIANWQKCTLHRMSSDSVVEFWVQILLWEPAICKWSCTFLWSLCILH